MVITVVIIVLIVTVPVITLSQRDRFGVRIILLVRKNSVLHNGVLKKYISIQYVPGLSLQEENIFYFGFYVKTSEE
jgi:hypothetical protein